MSVALDIEGNGRRGERIALRAGQIATVGRSPWADVSLPAASELADEHFRLDCRHAGCRLDAVDGVVLRNGVKTDSAMLVDGDALSAGAVQFRVHVFGLTESRINADPAGSSPDQDQTADGFAAILQRAALSAEGREVVIAGERLGTLDALLAAGLQKDACRFAAACLPAVTTIDWAVRQLDGAGLSPEELEQLSAYVSGAANAPSAEQLDRRIASLPPSAPQTWLWKAARWSGGSLSGAGLPPVPPAPHLFAVAVSVALSLATSQRDRDAFADWIASARELIVALTQSEASGSLSEFTTSSH